MGLGTSLVEDGDFKYCGLDGEVLVIFEDLFY